MCEDFKHLFTTCRRLLAEIKTWEFEADLRHRNVFLQLTFNLLQEHCVSSHIWRPEDSTRQTRANTTSVETSKKVGGYFKYSFDAEAS